MMKVSGASRYEETRVMLLELLQQGIFPQNKLESEEELARELGISVATIREVLRELDREGYITKKHGSGNYVHKSAFSARMRIDQTKDYIALLKDRFRDVHTVQSGYQVVEMDDFQAAHLQAEAGERALLYTRKFLVDGERAAILAINCIPLRFLTRDIEKLTEQVSIMRFLWENCSQEMVQNIVRLRACNCSGEVATALSLEVGRALVCWEEVFYNLQDRPVGLTESYFHPDLVDMHLLVKRK